MAIKVRSTSLVKIFASKFDDSGHPLLLSLTSSPWSYPSNILIWTTVEICQHHTPNFCVLRLVSILYLNTSNVKQHENKFCNFHAVPCKVIQSLDTVHYCFTQCKMGTFYMVSLSPYILQQLPFSQFSLKLESWKVPDCTMSKRSSSLVSYHHGSFSKIKLLYWFNISHNFYQINTWLFTMYLFFIRFFFFLWCR